MDSPAQKYIRSIKDPVKKRYAQAHLDWVAAGKVGAPVARGALSAHVAEVLRLNLESLL
jgi:hypothetical protein